MKRGMMTPARSLLLYGMLSIARLFIRKLTWCLVIVCVCGVGGEVRRAAQGDNGQHARENMTGDKC